MLCQQTSPKRWFGNVNFGKRRFGNDVILRLKKQRMRISSNNDHHTPLLNIRVWQGGTQSSSRRGHHQTSTRHCPRLYRACVQSTYCTPLPKALKLAHLEHNQLHFPIWAVKRKY